MRFTILYVEVIPTLEVVTARVLYVPRGQIKLNSSETELPPVDCNSKHFPILFLVSSLHFGKSDHVLYLLNNSRDIISSL